MYCMYFLKNKNPKNPKGLLKTTSFLHTVASERSAIVGDYPANFVFIIGVHQNTYFEV